MSLSIIYLGINERKLTKLAYLDSMSEVFKNGKNVI